MQGYWLFKLTIPFLLKLAHHVGRGTLQHQFLEGSLFGTGHKRDPCANLQAKQDGNLPVGNANLFSDMQVSAAR